MKEDIKNVAYPLPKGWKWVRLGEIFDIKRGGSPRPILKYLTIDKNGINWIKIGDAKEGSKYIVETKEKIKAEGKKKSRIVKPDDLLLSNSMSYGKAFISKIEGCIHDGWLLLRPVNKDIFVEYFYYLLNSYVLALQFKNNVQGGIVKNLNIEIVKNTIVPLPFKNGKPDIEKQKQIVEKIETIFKEIDKAIDLRQKALEDTIKLFESVLNKIFKEAEEDKDNWKWVRLGNYCKVQNGYAFKSKDFEDEGIPVIRISDIQNGIATIDNAKKINVDMKKYEKFLIKKGDILIAMSGATTGKLGIFLLNKPALLNQRVGKFDINIRFIDKNLFFFLLQKISEKILRKSYGMAQPNISGKEIEDFKIPLPIKNNQPDLEKQKEIAYYLDNLHNKIKQLEELQKLQLEKFNKLKESILNKAFRGELV